MVEQENRQGSEKRSYEGSPWLNVHDFQVSEHTNSQTGEKFWDVKLASNTFIEHNGEKLDVSKFHFTTNVEPALSHGEVGEPGAVRGIHFPNDWNITLLRFENTAPEGQTPVFKEVGRVEGITPQQLADGLNERTEAWRVAHKREPKEQQQAVGEQAQQAVKKVHSAEMAI